MFDISACIGVTCCGANSEVTVPTKGDTVVLCMFNDLLSISRVIVELELRSKERGRSRTA